MTASLCHGEFATVTEATLTTKEIQTALGILAWRVKVPKAYGERISIQYDQFIGDKKVLNHHYTTVVDKDDRDVLVTLRTIEDNYSLITTTKNCTTSSTVPVKMVEGDANLDHSLDITENNPPSPENEIILMRWIYRAGKNPTAEPDDRFVIATRKLSITACNSEQAGTACNSEQAGAGQPATAPDSKSQITATTSTPPSMVLPR